MAEIKQTQGLARLRELYQDNATFKRQTDDRGNFKRGVSAGVDQVQAMGYGAMGAAGDILESNKLTEFGVEGYQRNIDEAGESAGDIQRIEDAESVADFGDWAAHALGSQLPMLGTVVATGGVGGAVGATAAKMAGKRFITAQVEKQAAKLMAAGMGEREAARLGAKMVVRNAAKTATKAGAYGAGVGMETGNIFGEIEGETGQTEGMTALVFGTAAGMLEAAPLMRIFDRIGISRFDAQSGIMKHVARVAKGARDQAGVEGLTEGMQTIVEQSAVDYIQDNLGAFSSDDLSEILNAVTAGALVGGVIGGPAALSEGSSMTRAQTSRDDIESKKALAQSTQDPVDSKQFEADATKLAQTRIKEIRAAATEQAAQGDETAVPRAMAEIKELQEIVNRPIKQDMSDKAQQALNLPEPDAGLTDDAPPNDSQKLANLFQMAKDNIPLPSLAVNRDVPTLTESVGKGTIPEIDVGTPSVQVPDPDAGLTDPGDPPASPVEIPEAIPRVNKISEAEFVAQAEQQDVRSLTAFAQSLNIDPSSILELQDNGELRVDIPRLYAEARTATDEGPDVEAIDIPETTVSGAEQAQEPLENVDLLEEGQPELNDTQERPEPPVSNVTALDALPNDPEGLRARLSDIDAQANLTGASPGSRRLKNEINKRLFDLEKEPEDIFDRKGNPYKSEKAATRRRTSLKLTDTHDVVSIGSGFGLRPKTEGESTDGQTQQEGTEAPRNEPARETEELENDAATRGEAGEASESSVDGAFGKANAVFTADAANAARERLRKKLAGGTVNAGFDPELMVDGATLAGFYIEGGLRKFPEYANAMVNDLGDAAKPYLEYWYESVRSFPGFDSTGMTPIDEVNAQPQESDTDAQAVTESDTDSTPSTDAVESSTEQDNTDSPDSETAPVDAETPDSPVEPASTDSTPEQIEAERAEVNTSPSKEQIEADNYKKGHIRVFGYDVSIENPAGSFRKDKETGGKKWKVKMLHDYGDIKGTSAADGDNLDAFIRNDYDPTNEQHQMAVFIVDQVNQDGKFDEHKIMIGWPSEAEATDAYLSAYDKGWTGLGSITGLPPEDFKTWVDSGDLSKAYAKAGKKKVSTAPEHQGNENKPLDESRVYPMPDRVSSDANVLPEDVVDMTIDPKQFLEITDEFAELFKSPGKERVIVDGIAKRSGYISIKEANTKIDQWAANASAQRSMARSDVWGSNQDKTILSLFDLTGAWSQPYVDAGYNVLRFDVQNDALFGDVNKFSSEFFVDNFNVSEVFGILAACPCTDFSSSGSGHFAIKDADGRTEASKELVFQTLRTIEYFRPKMWALENPVGRIARLTGLPNSRLSFHPHHFGENYTKRTLLWGQFNANLELANTEPTEGSVMATKYGGKSQATKNARSATPEGFSYSFFNSNNFIDATDEQKLRWEYPEVSGAAVAVHRKGVDAEEVAEAINFDYGNQDYADALKTLSKMSRLTGKSDKPAVVSSNNGDSKTNDKKRTDAAQAVPAERTETTPGGTPLPAEQSTARTDNDGVDAAPATNDSGSETGRSADAGSTRSPGSNVGGESEVRSTGSTGQSSKSLRGTLDAEPGRSPARTRQLTDFHIADPLKIVGGGQVARFNKNKAAIELFNTLTDESKRPTKAQMDTLAGYTGWGSFGQELFNGSWGEGKPKDDWKERDAWLRSHLGEDAWKSAQRSITNAHYTDPPTVMAMWDMVKRMGFRGGRVLEPAMGIGNFFGMMPKALKSKSDLTGIELDEMTGGIAKMLYPASNIAIKPYQKSETPDNFYDVIIGNWPFENTSVADRRYNKLNPYLHDYFFLKAMDQVRPGGLVVGITSKGTMDKVDNSIRRALAKKGELLAAFRLPTGAFKEYAGTAVVTDIIILQKRAEPVELVDDAWIQTAKYTTPSGEDVNLNQYYHDNPDNVIGVIDYGHGTTTGQAGMIVNRPDDVQAELTKRIAMVPKGAYSKERTKRMAYLVNHTAERVGTLTRTDDGLIVAQGEQALKANDIVRYEVKSQETTAQREAELDGLIGLRRSYASLMDAEQKQSDNLESVRADLNKAYKAHTKTHGPINDSWGMAYFDKLDEPNVYVLRALESKRDDKWQPATILKESTTRGKPTLENPSIQEAFVLARNDDLEPLLSDVAELANATEDDVRAVLLSDGAVFEDVDGKAVPSDVYLSGNVRVKHRLVKAAVDDGATHLQRNVDALAEVIPADIPYHEIEVKLGATWVPESVYEKYVAHMLNESDVDQFKVSYKNGLWRMDMPKSLELKAEASSGYGHSHQKARFKTLVNRALRNQTITITEYVRDVGQVKNQAATDEANEVIGKIREDFMEWVWSDPERRVDLEKEYNEVRNAFATPKYDGSFLTFEGMALKIGDGNFDLRPHQRDAIWRGLTKRRSMNAHEVGTGKTFTLAGIAIESRRYGLAKKPMVLAHNANSKAVASEINMMYPNAKVLYIDNLSPKTIDLKLRQIANDDWDAVVIPHSLLDRMSMKYDTLMAMAAEEIEAFEQEAKDAAEDDGVVLTDAMIRDPEELKKLRSPTAKDLVKARNRILSTIEKQSQRSSREGAVSFEELGVDMVIVDEVHAFKKPPLTTRMRMKGLQTDASARSIALQFMTRYIRANNGGNNVHTFTGTMITNTLTELYHQMRYVMPDEMEAAGVEQWDGFFGSFASEVLDVELSAAGEYENVTRLASFINVPELRQMVGQYMDVVFADDMPAMAPRLTDSGKTMSDPTLSEAERAELENGYTQNATNRPYKKVIALSADMTPAQLDAFNNLQQLAMEWRNGSNKARKEWMMDGDPRSPIITEQMANRASFDIRLLQGEMLAGQEGKVPDDPNSKASRVVDQVLDIHRSDERATQVVFMGLGISKTGSRSVGKRGAKTTQRFKTFSTMHDIIERLVQGGIPREQIAVIDGSTNKSKRKEIADKMNRSEIRVTLGSVSAMGVGVNMQRNLRAMHHVDAPYMPGDLEQANGRGHRQGNQWNTVREYRYLTDRLDGRRWQILAIKQKFIKSFMTADGKSRVLEGDAVNDEESDILQTFSEAAGDPRILIKEKMKKTVEKLRKRERLYTQSVADATRRTRQLKSMISDNEAGLVSDAALAKTITKLQKLTKKQFNATIDGVEYDKRADADRAIVDWITMNMRVGSGEKMIGDMHGVPLFARWPGLSPTPRVGLVWEINGKSHTAHTDNKSNFFQGIEARMRTLLTAGATREGYIEEQKASLTRMEEVAAEPFKQADELKSAIDQVVQLETDMEMNPVPPPAWLRQGAPIGTDVVWNGASLEVTGHRWTPEGWFVVAEDAKGSQQVPYSEAMDDQGISIYETREFEAPEVITKKKDGDELTEADRVPTDSQLKGSNSPRRAGDSSPKRLQKLNRWKDAIMSSWMTEYPVTIVATQLDLPQPVLDSAEKQGIANITAVHHKGSLHIVGDQIRSRRGLERAMLHERQHSLVREMLGHKGLQTTLGQIAKIAQAEGGIDALAEKLGVDLSDYSTGFQRLVDTGRWTSQMRDVKLLDELMAFKTMEYVGTVGRLKRLYDMLLTKIRRWMRSHQLASLSNVAKDELLHVLFAGETYYRRGAAAATDTASALDTVLLDVDLSGDDAQFMVGSAYSEKEGQLNIKPQTPEGETDPPSQVIRQVSEVLDRYTEPKGDRYGEFKRKVYQKINRLKDTSGREVLGLLTRRQLVESGRKLLPRMDEYLADAELLDAARRELHSEAATIAEDWGKLPDKVRDSLAAMMQSATIAGADPDTNAQGKYQPLITELEFNKEMSRLENKKKQMIAARDPEGTGPILTRIEALERLKAQEYNRQFNLGLLSGAQEKKARERPGYGQLADAWSNLDESAKEIYRRSRDHHVNETKQYEQAIEDQIIQSMGTSAAKDKLWGEIKATFEKNRVTAPYFPLSRFGDFWVSVGEGRNRSVDTFETQAEQIEFVRQQQDAGETVEFGKNLKRLMEIQQVPHDFILAVDNLLDTGKPQEKSPIAFKQRDELYQLYLSTLPAISSRHHFQHRKNVRGFSHDALRAFATSSFHGAGMVARAKFMHRLDRTLNEIEQDIAGTTKMGATKRRIALLNDYRTMILSQGVGTKINEVRDALYPDLEKLNRQHYTRIDAMQVLQKTHPTEADVLKEVESLEQRMRVGDDLNQDPATKAKATDYLEELKQSHARLANPNSHPLATALNSIGFGFFLGVTPAAAMVNMTQVPLVTLPILGARYGHKKASKALSDSYKQFFSARDEAGKRQFTVFDSLTGEEKEAFAELVRRGVIDVTQAHDLAGLSEDGQDYNAFTYKIKKVMSFSFHHAERLNREVTALTAYRLARKAGKDHTQSMQEAGDMVWKTQFDYGGTNRARYFSGNWARVLLQFKQYSAGVTYLYVDTFRNAFGDAPAAEKAEARRALKSLLTLQFAVTGALGMPLARSAGMLIETLVHAFDDEDDFSYETAIRQGTADLLKATTFGLLGNDTATALTKGVFDGFTPISIHGRLSLSELWYREPFKEMEGRDQWTHVLKQIAGPTAGIMEGLFVGSALMMDGKIERGLEYMTPKIVRDVLKGGRFVMEDARTLGGNELIDTRIDQAILQAMGFSPSALANRYDENAARKSLQSAITTRRSGLLREFYDAQRERDRKELKAIEKQINEFNQKFKQYPITRSTLKRSVSSRERANRETVGGMRPNNALKGSLSRIDFAQ